MVSVRLRLSGSWVTAVVKRDCYDESLSAMHIAFF